MNSSSSSLPDHQRRKIMRTVFFALLVDILSFTVILPLFPRLLNYYRINESKNSSSLFSITLHYVHKFKAIIGATDLNTSNNLDVILFGGIIGSLFSLLQFIVSPYIGSLSDKYGRKPILMLCMVGNLLSCLLWVIAKPFWVFLLSRIVGGLSEGNVQLSLAMISDITTPHTRSRGLALVGIAFAIGFTLGPALGAYMASLDLSQFKMTTFFIKWGMNPYSASALFAALLIFIEIIYLHIALPETLTIHYVHHHKNNNNNYDNNMIKVNPVKTPTNHDVSTSKKLLSTTTSSHSQCHPISRKTLPTSALTILSLLHFAYLFCFSGLEFTLTFYTYDHYGYTNRDQGMLLGYIGLITALVQGGYTRRQAHNIGESRVALQGILSCSLAFMLLAWTSTIGPGLLFWLAATLLAFTSATVVTCLTTLASLHINNTSSILWNDTVTTELSTTDISNPLPSSLGSELGQAMGTFRSWGQLGRSIGPIVACATYWMIGGSATYIIGSILLFTVGIWLRRVQTIISSTIKYDDQVYRNNNNNNKSYKKME